MSYMFCFFIFPEMYAEVFACTISLSITVSVSPLLTLSEWIFQIFRRHLWRTCRLIKGTWYAVTSKGWEDFNRVENWLLIIWNLLLFWNHKKKKIIRLCRLCGNHYAARNLQLNRLSVMNWKEQRQRLQDSDSVAEPEGTKKVRHRGRISGKGERKK